MKKRTVLVAAGIIVALAIAKGVMLYLKNNDDGPKALINKVGQHYLLPANEAPTIATVTDRAKLTTEFLKAAKNGDKVLIYEKSGVVIIYRPSADRLVKVGPVDIAPSDDTSRVSSVE